MILSLSGRQWVVKRRNAGELLRMNEYLAQGGIFKKNSVDCRVSKLRADPTRCGWTVAFEQTAYSCSRYLIDEKTPLYCLNVPRLVVDIDTCGKRP